MTAKLPAPTHPLALYKDVRAGLAKLVRVDEVKRIRDQASALEFYAYQAKDAQLACHAVEVKLRAARRLGELLKELRKAGRLARGTRGQLNGRSSGGLLKNPPEKNAATLAEQKIDKHLAHTARQLAEVSDHAFEVSLAKRAKLAVAACEGNRAFIAEARRELNIEKKKRRAKREREFAEGTLRASRSLGKKLYGVIYADPPWRYSISGDARPGNEQHYPTMEIADICALRIPAADDCALFMWTTVTHLEKAFDVVRAWRFIYTGAAIVWHKDQAGTGYWIRGECELLLICTRGNVPAPAPGEQLPAHIEAPRTSVHSEKPDVFAHEIERLFPNTPKLEMFARKARPHWDVWGNEVAEANE